MARLLVVEDCKEICEIIQEILAERYHLTFASNMNLAKLYLSEMQFDLLLLDLNLPDGHGFDLYGAIKATINQNTPSIFLTGAIDLPSRLKGLQLGAQDYMTKPFYPEELAARIQLRLALTKDKTKLHSCADLRFDWCQQRVYRQKENGEQLLNLTPNEYKILSALGQNFEKIMSRPEIVKSVWGEGFHLSNKVVNTHISNLRGKIKEARVSIVASGNGYLLKERKAA